MLKVLEINYVIISLYVLKISFFILFSMISMVYLKVLFIIFDSWSRFVNLSTSFIITDNNSSFPSLLNTPLFNVHINRCPTNRVLTNVKHLVEK